MANGANSGFAGQGNDDEHSSSGHEDGGASFGVGPNSQSELANPRTVRGLFSEVTELNLKICGVSVRTKWSYGNYAIKMPDAHVVFGFVNNQYQQCVGGLKFVVNVKKLQNILLKKKNGGHRKSTSRETPTENCGDVDNLNGQNSTNQKESDSATDLGADNVTKTESTTTSSDSEPKVAGANQEDQS